MPEPQLPLWDNRSQRPDALQIASSSSLSSDLRSINNVCPELAERIPYDHLSQWKLAELLWVAESNQERVRKSGPKVPYLIPISRSLLLLIHDSRTNQPHPSPSIGVYYKISQTIILAQKMMIAFLLSTPTTKLFWPILCMLVAGFLNPSDI